MLFRSLRSSAATRLVSRNIHSSAPRLDTATSAKNAATGASKQLSNLAARAQSLGKPLVDRASSLTGGELLYLLFALKELFMLLIEDLQLKTWTVNVSSFTDSLAYNLRVVGSVFKQVYIAEGMAPPRSFSTIQEAYQTMYSRAIDANFWSKMYNNGDWKKFAIYSLEVYGIFTIGEMVSESLLLVLSI